MKFISAMQLVRNELVRGVWTSDGWRTSDGNFVIAGCDARDPVTNTFTLLRKYNRDGIMLVDKGASISIGEIRSIYKYLASDDFIAMAYTRFVRMDENLTVTAKTFTNLGLPNTSTSLASSTISPADNGIAFLPIRNRRI